MAVLSKGKIIELIKDEKLKMTPALDSLQLRPHAVDLRLGFTFMIPETWKMTPKGREAVIVDTSAQTDPARNMDIVELEESQYFEILPGEFVVATTLERLEMPEDVMATLYPRSSQSRKGLSIDLTGIVDAGYHGNLIIPMENKTHQPIKLYPGERFCQLTFEFVEGDVEIIPSRYKNKDVIVGVLPEKDTDEIELIKAGKIKELKEKYPQE